MRRVLRATLVALLLAAGGVAEAAEVVGITAGPVPVDAFARIEKGMGEQLVVSMVGLPSAEGFYRPRLDRVLSVVGLGDAYRTYFYRGLGRVLFVGGNPLLRTGVVAKVEIDATEPGTPR